MEDKIENQVMQDLGSLLKQAVQKKHELTDLRYYPAKVTATNDPLKLGRVRVRVFGVFGDDIPDDECPWAIPNNGSKFSVPPVDSVINIFFENDDIYRPKYADKVTNVDYFKNLESNYDEDYPESIIFFETENGDYFKINKATLEMTFRHASGTVIKINKSGDINIDNKSSDNGELNINIKGDVKISSNKNVEIVAGQKISLNTLDSSLWLPNTMAVCPYTGSPHGGATAGITNLGG